MELCQLSTVKDLIGIEQETTKEDDVLNHLIAAVSAQIERYLGRTIETDTYTEYFNVDAGSATFSVKAYPVTSVTSVKNSIDWDWAGTTAVSADYVEYDSHPGLIYVYGQQLVAGHGALQIVYTGGMASNTQELSMGSYADIALAAEQQVIATWRARSSFGMTNAGAGANTAMFGEGGLIQSVRQLLDPHRRRVYV